jgi:hypothetical protein
MTMIGFPLVRDVTGPGLAGFGSRVSPSPPVQNPNNEGHRSRRSIVKPRRSDSAIDAASRARFERALKRTA